MSVTASLFIFAYGGLTLALAWRDCRTGFLPDALTCPLLWCGLLFHVLLLPQRLPSSVLGAIAGYGSLAAVYWIYRGVRQREGLGYGDVKFFAALGAWHEWQQLPALMTLSTSFALLFVGITTVLQGSELALKNPLRFGPFLSAAGWVLAWQSGIILPL